MKAWEIWSYQPESWPEAHPAVITSAPLRVANKPEINVLVCTSKANRPRLPFEVLLDEADGLDWPTFCKCDLFHLVRKEMLRGRRGEVTTERRRQIIATINQANGWV